MSRLQTYVLAAGVLLILLGLLIQDRTAVEVGAAAGRGNRPAKEGVGPPLGRGGPAPDRAKGGGRLSSFPSAAPSSGSSRDTTARPAVDPVQPTVEVLARHAGDGSPAAGATIGLWRRATGEGVTYRPARRIADDQVADLEGRATFVARPDWPLEIVARAAGNGPMLRVPVEALAAGSHREVQVRVERPPAPLRIVVQSDDGIPLVGASVRTLAEVQPPRGAFPGRSSLVRRTDGNGFADLDGADRERPWIVVEAAGFGPLVLSEETLALRARSLRGAGSRQQVEVTLSSAAGLDVEVTDRDSAPVQDVQVRIEFDLDGLPLESVASTGRRGRVRIGDLPAGVGITFAARDPGSSEPSFQEVYVLEPGERRAIAVQLDR
ncbi:MAG: hypothetical protein AAF957_03790 [Planctomycetota bacterium]